ncbi:MAG: hypothetical protein FWC98_02880, partial [Bacteroidales bacterium]|nr:hypothetical protein [Bacteroidales bacterium]
MQGKDDIVSFRLIEQQVDKTINALARLSDKIDELGGRMKNSLEPAVKQVKTFSDLKAVSEKVTQAKKETIHVLETEAKLQKQLTSLLEKRVQVEQKNLNVTTTEIKGLSQLQKQLNATKQAYIEMSAEMRNNATGRKALSGIRDLIEELGIAKFATGKLGDTFDKLSGDVSDALANSDKFVQLLTQMGVQLPKVVTGKAKFISKIKSAVVALKAMLATPVGKFIAVLVAGMAIIQAFGYKLRNLLPSQRALNDFQERGNQIVQERARRELEWEEGAVERLKLEREISSETATQEERLDAINRLNELNLQNAKARLDELERELAIMEQQAEVEANRVRWNDILTVGIGRRGRVERRLAAEQEAIDGKR